MAPDLKQIVQSAGVALERTAYEKFGAVIEEASSGMLKDVFQIPKTGDGLVADAGKDAGLPGVFTSTRYAAALTKTGQADYNPKLKFLFKVSFEFHPDMRGAASTMSIELDEIQRDVGFMIRHIDRPKFDFEYEEVNMYNFRTKVLKAIKHRELALTLYDDIGNQVLNFVNVYRKLLQPVVRQPQMPSTKFGDYGMEFDESYSGLDSSHRGPLPNDAINVLSKMTIHQIFVERGSNADNPSSWVKMVDFNFINPRFTNIDVDDMDHENGGAFNLVTMTVDYDLMYMSEVLNFSHDAVQNLPSGDISADNPSGGVSGRNPFIDIVVNQTARLGQKAFSDKINKVLGGSVGGQIVAGQLSRIGGTLADAARKTLWNQSAQTGIAIASNPAVSDASTPLGSIANLSKRIFS